MITENRFLAESIFYVCLNRLLYKQNHFHYKFRSQRFVSGIKTYIFSKPAMRKSVLFFTFLCIFGASFAGLTVKGGKKPVTDQEALDNLSKSVVEHLKKLDGQGKLELVEMQSATYQTVAGTKYEIDAKLKENDTPVDCTIVLWEKPWITDFLKLDVECGEEKRKYSYAAGVDADRRKRSSDVGGIRFGGPFSALSQNDLDSMVSKLGTVFSLLSTQNEDFDYLLKLVESGKSQIVFGSHSIVQVLAASKDHADQNKHCEVDFYENVQSEVTNVSMKCEDNDKTFLYKKTINLKFE